ncbi:MAG TPA: PHP domain-containing protein, partial [Megamonas funiformis]|nr:PHP domain-containing protein [Megamonas funiformis]
MYKVDYHHHSKFSFDGKDFLEDICKKAIEIDLDEICFTEHFDVDPKDVSYGVLDYKAYHECIELCKQKYGNKLNIKRGLEIGEPHLKPYLETLKSEIEKMDLDFIIGSVHNINSIKLRLTMPSKTKSKIYEDYFNEILAMVK